jgi:hypothetical protein
MERETLSAFMVTRSLTWLVVALALGLGLAPIPSPASVASSTGSTVAVGPTPRSTGVYRVIDVTSDGRIALLDGHGRISVRDLVRNRTLRKLHSGEAYEYFAISNDGRYVSYTKRARLKGCWAWQPKVRDVVTNRTRFVATTKSGRMLRAEWTPTNCRGETPGISRPTLSGNGRYVTFEANLRAPNQWDTYIKDLKRGTLRIIAGYGTSGISANGRVVLLVRNQDPPAPSNAFSLLIGGSELRDGIAGTDPQLTEDGSAVYATIATQSIRYDIASGNTLVLPPPSPGRAPMSATGRYALLETRPPEDPGLHLLVYDRNTGTVTDLTPMFSNAGLRLNGDEDTGAYPLPPIISDDGKVVFASAIAEGGNWDLYYALNWMG